MDRFRRLLFRLGVMLGNNWLKSFIISRKPLTSEQIAEGQRLWQQMQSKEGYHAG